MAAVLAGLLSPLLAEPETALSAFGLLSVFAGLSHFVHDVTQALSDAGMRPDQLCLEVTETALLADPAGAKATLTAISRLGVRIALDDFGTGYSSLTHLRQFPVDLVKVDRSFVANIGEGPGQDYGIVASTISMAGHLGLEVTAEGVETSGQRSALEAMGCPLLQGFLIARPMPGEDLLAWDAARAAANIPDQRAVLF